MLGPFLGTGTSRASLSYKAWPCPEEVKEFARPSWPHNLPFHCQNCKLRNPHEGGLHPILPAGNACTALWDHLCGLSPSPLLSSSHFGGLRLFKKGLLLDRSEERRVGKECVP